MSKPTVDSRIWEILRRYEDKLTFEERSDVACELDDLFDEAKKSTSDFNTIIALEIQAGQIAELTGQVKTLHTQLAAVSDEHSVLRKCIESFATSVYTQIM